MDRGHDRRRVPLVPGPAGQAQRLLELAHRRRRSGWLARGQAGERRIGDPRDTGDPDLAARHRGRPGWRHRRRRRGRRSRQQPSGRRVEQLGQYDWRNRVRHRHRLGPNLDATVERVAWRVAAAPTGFLLMPVALILIGGILIVVAFQNTMGQLARELEADIPGFFVWVVAIAAILGLGYVPGLKTP